MKRNANLDCSLNAFWPTAAPPPKTAAIETLAHRLRRP